MHENLNDHRHKKIQKVAPRISVDLTVKTKTIGSRLSYELVTANISKSGVLLVWNKQSKLPFLEKTIIEMEIDPDCHWLSNPVNCMGNVIRKVETPHTEDSTGLSKQEFGIAIIALDTKDNYIWEQCVSDLQRREFKKLDDTFHPKK